MSKMDTLGILIDQKIEETIHKYKYALPPTYGENPFEDLLSMGELIDRLSIVNIKLYMLKDEVMKRPNDTDFLARASRIDVCLVEERARLKKCIDQKILNMIADPNFNPEVKSYGTDFND